MVAIMNQNFFEQSKTFFENGDIKNTLEAYEKAISYIDQKDKSSYIQFLNQILSHCRENNLKEEEAVVLRSLGRTHSIFKQYVESLKYHEESLKIQRKLGKKIDVAEGLLYLAEDLEVSGNYENCIKAFQDAEELYQELGKLRKVKEIKKELSRLMDFSKQMVEDEYYLKEFNIDKY
ncbi:MAG: tetratricopeptide repeat protein [Promethearchaeota archaeon]|nr:MAG: tetratricopeptide repeat protein [Candidatus Lokiarchaeota archaeon]